MRRKNRRSRASSIIETIVGITLLIPICLFLFDVAVLVLANAANDSLAKSACRAAASATDATGAATITAAKTAAQNIVNRFAIDATSLIRGRNLQRICYNTAGVNQTAIGTSPGVPVVPAGMDAADPGRGNCAVTTWMRVVFPFPIPFQNSFPVFFARAVEPIVAIPPQ